MITLWLSAVMLVIFALVKQNEFFKDTQTPIAKLNKSLDGISDGILVRSESVVRWQQAVEEQSLYDGDWVASGPFATTKVVLSSGQILDIGEDSQIQIRAIMRQNEQNSFLVSLARGSVFADLKSDCQKCPSITIKSDEKSFNVASGQSVGIVKEIGKSMEKMTSKTALPVFKGKKTAMIGILDKNFVTTVEKTVVDTPKNNTNISGAINTQTGTGTSSQTNTVSPLLPPAIKPVKINVPQISLRQYMVKIQADPNQKIMYTTDQKLDAIKHLKFRIDLNIPPIPFKSRNLIAGLKIYSDTNKTSVILEATPGESFVLIPISLIASLGSQIQTGYIKDYRIKMMPGLRLENSQKNPSDYKGSEVELTLRILGDWNRDMVELSLDQLKSDINFHNPWSPNKNLLAKDQAPYRVLIYQSSEIVKLRSLIRGSGAIGISPIQNPSLEGFYIIKDRRILGEIAGTQINEGFFKVITHALGAETIYKGKRQAFYDQSNISNLNNSIGKMLDEGKTIYILKKGKTYPVNRDFIKTNAEVAGFVDSQAKAIFLEKVDIIYSL